MDADERLAAAAGGAVRYYADAAGLENEVILQLQASVISACKFCFTCHPSAAHCDIRVERLPDRLQVELALPGAQPPPANEKPAFPGIDEVECGTNAEAGILRLTKFLPPEPPAAE